MIFVFLISVVPVVGDTKTSTAELVKQKILEGKSGDYFIIDGKKYEYKNENTLKLGGFDKNIDQVLRETDESELIKVTKETPGAWWNPFDEGTKEDLFSTKEQAELFVKMVDEEFGFAKGLEDPAKVLGQIAIKEEEAKLARELELAKKAVGDDLPLSTKVIEGLALEKQANDKLLGKIYHKLDSPDISPEEYTELENEMNNLEDRNKKIRGELSSGGADDTTLAAFDKLVFYDYEGNVVEDEPKATTASAVTATKAVKAADAKLEAAKKSRSYC